MAGRRKSLARPAAPLYAPRRDVHAFAKSSAAGAREPSSLLGRLKRLAAREAPRPRARRTLHGRPAARRLAHQERPHLAAGDALPCVPSAARHRERPPDRRRQLPAPRARGAARLLHPRHRVAGRERPHARSPGSRPASASSSSSATRATSPSPSISTCSSARARTSWRRKGIPARGQGPAARAVPRGRAAGCAARDRLPQSLGGGAAGHAARHVPALRGPARRAGARARPPARVHGGGGDTPPRSAEAVAFASFDRMKEKERDGFFQSRRLGADRRPEPESYKVREGVVGGYRRHVAAGAGGPILDAAGANPARPRLWLCGRSRVSTAAHSVVIHPGLVKTATSTLQKHVFRRHPGIKLPGPALAHARARMGAAPRLPGRTRSTTSPSA